MYIIALILFLIPIFYLQFKPLIKFVAQILIKFLIGKFLIILSFFLIWFLIKIFKEPIF